MSTSSIPVSNKIISPSDMIPDIKQSVSSPSSTLDILRLKDHQRRKTRHFKDVIKYLETKSTQDYNPSSFKSFEWLNPLLVKEKDLNRRLEALEILQEMAIPVHTYSVEMTNRLFFWARTVSPEVRFSRFGRELITSQERTNEFKRLQRMSMTLNRRINEPDMKPEDKRDLDLRIKETRKSMRAVLSCLQRSIKARHVEEDVNDKTPSKDPLTKLKYEWIFRQLPDIRPDSYPSVNQAINVMLKSHPFFSTALLTTGSKRTGLVIKYLLQKGLSSIQIINGIHVILYDFQAVVSAFESLELTGDWKDDPYLISQVVYRIKCLACFVRNDALFGGGILFSLQDLLSRQQSQPQEVSSSLSPTNPCI